MNAHLETAVDPANTARMTTPADHRLSSDEGGLGVVFSWQTDRFTHVIQAADDRRLISIEGSPEDDWPTAAAISQLSTEIIEGRPTILGVGCSGTTHFSVSVQLDDDADGVDGADGVIGEPVIRFDWAARLAKPLSAADVASPGTLPGQHETPLAWLGSTYRLPTGDPSEWDVDMITGTLTEPNSDDREGRLSLQPTRIDEVRTVVWSYRIKIKSATSGK